ncbi:hypothetical protein ACFWY9_32560 [Amycolatopsis sp. NPDC059027]
MHARNLLATPPRLADAPARLRTVCRCRSTPRLASVPARPGPSKVGATW